MKKRSDQAPFPMPSEKPLTVLLLTSSYPRNKTDNSSIFLRYLAKNLAEQHINIHVLAPDHVSVNLQALDPGVKTHWFKYLPTSWQNLAYGSGILPNLKRNPFLYLQVPFFLIAMFFSLFILCRKIKPDVIHAHWIIPQGLITILVGKLLNIPVVATAHGGDAFSLNNGILSQLKKFTIRHSTAWTSNTMATASAFNSAVDIPEPTIVPMGVDIEHFQSGNKNNVITSEKRKVILFVGRLVEKKGVKYLIEAFSKLPKKTQNTTVLWIIGGGDERMSLEKQAAHLNIANIKFWGQIQNKQLPDFYAAATLFIAPSVIDSKGDTEGQGVILLEAMASDTPIISTKVGGIPEVINHGETGLLVQANSSVELSSTIFSLLNNKKQAKELTDNAKLHVEKNYAWPVVSQQFISLFKQNAEKSVGKHRTGFSSTSNRHKKAQKILIVLKKELRIQIKGKSILDIGTGSGAIASYLGKENHVTSVDISDSRASITGYNFSIANELLPFKENSFDIIISNHVIEHVQNQQLHINEIKHSLRPDGVLYLATPNRLWPFEVHYKLYFLHYLPQKLFIKALKLLNKYEEDVDLVSLKKIHSLLDKNNLQSYSGKVIKNPRDYLMNAPKWLEGFLNVLPLVILDKITFIHPTFVFTYKK